MKLRNKPILALMAKIQNDEQFDIDFEAISCQVEDFDFKKIAQSNIKKNYAPLLKKNGFSQYKRNVYVRENDKLVEIIRFQVRQFDLRIFTYYLPLFYGTDQVISFGATISDYCYIGVKSYGSVQEQYDSYMEGNVTNQFKKMYIILQELVLKEMNRMKSFHHFTNALRDKDVTFFGEEPFNWSEKAPNYRYFFGVEKCLTGDFSKGISLLKNLDISKEDVLGSLKYRDNLLCDSREEFMIRLEEVCQNRRLDYKL